MLNLSLGPLALPLNPLLMLAGWWLAGWVADRLLKARPAGATHDTYAESAPQAHRQVGRALTMAAVVGLLAARAGFVALAWSAYAARPLVMLDVRDGGWMPTAGAAAAIGVLGGFAWRHRAIARPLAAGVAAGVALWAAASAALGVHARPPLPALELPTLEGLPGELLAHDGRPTVINLWATWCAPCRVEMPELAAAQQHHAGVRFVFVNHGESPEAVRRWLSGQPYRLTHVLSDSRMQLAQAVGTSGLPTTLFVDAQGRMVERHFGPLSAASLEGKLRELLDEAAEKR
jgi:thiol-disulfide isomerase/thioredoxin